jgi:8-oxo-dGTP pyrophosphatase MutT (NUDIX family)
MLFLSAPKQFNPKFDVVSCFFEYDGKILLLQRQDNKPEGGTLGVPAGKIDGNETPHEAIFRELLQETGFSARKEDVIYFQKVFVRYPTYDFIYHIFSLKLGKKPIVKINPNEHKDFKWTKPDKALGMNLIQDLDACIKMFYGL